MGFRKFQNEPIREFYKNPIISCCVTMSSQLRFVEYLDVNRSDFIYKNTKVRLLLSRTCRTKAVARGAGAHYCFHVLPRLYLSDVSQKLESNRKCYLATAGHCPVNKTPPIKLTSWDRSGNFGGAKNTHTWLEVEKSQINRRLIAFAVVQVRQLFPVYESSLIGRTAHTYSTLAIKLKLS